MKKLCSAQDVSGEDPIQCSRVKGHKGPHKSGPWDRYDANGRKMKRAQMWLVWTGPTTKDIDE